MLPKLKKEKIGTVPVPLKKNYLYLFLKTLLFVKICVENYFSQAGTGAGHDWTGSTTLRVLSLFLS